jgi:hypothetical protein
VTGMARFFLAFSVLLGNYAHLFGRDAKFGVYPALPAVFFYFSHLDLIFQDLTPLIQQVR